ncbi:MAG: hypothetical protein IJ196_02890 [Prevotella sp.]|nr:hypothetical protein [Prevotella sp.]
MNSNTVNTWNDNPPAIDRQLVEQTLQQAFRHIMHISEDDRIRWCGPVSDLLELSHAMWLRGMAVDRFGRCITYTRLIRLLCRNLHVSCPKNHTAVINNIRRRKQPSSSLAERCRLIMANEGDPDPLQRFLEKME